MLGPNGGVAWCGKGVLSGGEVGEIAGHGIQRCLCLLVGPFWREVGCPGLQSVVKAASFGLQIVDHLEVINIVMVILLESRRCRDSGVEIDEPSDDPIAFEVVVRFTELSAVEHPIWQGKPSKHEQLNQPSSRVPDD